MEVIELEESGSDYQIHRNNVGVVIESDSIYCDSLKRFEVILIRHGETFKNDAKKLSKIKSYKCSEMKNVKATDSYDTDEQIEQIEPIENMSTCSEQILPDLPHITDKDSYLNDKGKSQAIKVARALLDREIETIYSSHITRAIQTAHIIGECLSAETRIDSDLHYEDKSVRKRSANLVRYLSSLANEKPGTILIVTHNQTLDTLYKTIYGYELQKTKYDNCAMSEIVITFEQNTMKIEPIYFRKIDNSNEEVSSVKLRI